MGGLQATTGLTISVTNTSVVRDIPFEKDTWLTLRIPILIGVCVGIALVTTILFCCLRRGDRRRNRKSNRKRKTSKSISEAGDHRRRSRRALASQRSRSLPSVLALNQGGRRERTRTEPSPVIELLPPLPSTPLPANSPRRQRRRPRPTALPSQPSLQALLAGSDPTLHLYYNQAPPVVDSASCVYYNTSTTTSTSSARSRSKGASGSSESSHPAMTPLLSPSAGNGDVFSENYFELGRRVDRDGYEMPKHKATPGSGDVTSGVGEDGRGGNSNPRESTGYVHPDNRWRKQAGVASLGQSAGKEGPVAPPSYSGCELKIDAESYLLAPKYKKDSSPHQSSTA